MKQYIDKTALVAEIEKRLHANGAFDEFGDEAWAEDVGMCNAYKSILSFLDTLEVKDDSLGNFKSLQHISRDLKSTLQDWGYAPNLYYFDGMWHVSWISCEEGDVIKDFEGNTPEETIDKACNWFHSTFCNS